MTLWTATDASKATGGRAQGNWSATGVSIDTRTLEPGDLFVALTDIRDGHDFVAQAFEKGAAAALVRHIPDGVADDAPLLIVSDVLEALEDLGRAARARTGARVIAVTGSVGKTSTKEMLRSALEGQGRVHAAEKSYNNHWGVPLTLARMPADTNYAVFEIGMNHPGEIAPLARMVRPHVAIITTVAEVHMEAFRSVKGIAREKAAILEGLEPGGTAILNRDIPTYPILARAAKKAGAVQVRFGYAGRPEYALKLTRSKGDATVVTYRCDGEKRHFKLGAPGDHLVMNALTVIAACDAVGADLAQSSINLAAWRPPAGRGSRFLVELDQAGAENTILLIDESYNANPTSMAAALNALAQTTPLHDIGRIARGRRIAIIGDMLELGPKSPEMHQDLSRLAAMAEIDIVHTVGPEMAHLARALPETRRGLHVTNADEIVPQIKRHLDAGDVVMVKASLGTGLGKLVDAIKALGQTRAPDTRETD